MFVEKLSVEPNPTTKCFTVIKGHKWTLYFVKNSKGTLKEPYSFLHT